MMSDDPEQFQPARPADASTPPASGKMAGSSPPSPAKRSVRYPNAYVWFVFLAALDVMLTYLILHPVLFSGDLEMTESRGAEANVLAGWIIERWDVPGLVLFKFVLVVLVVVLCEVIGRRKDKAGRRLAEWAVAITSIPVVLALIQMGFDLYLWYYPPQ